MRAEHEVRMLKLLNDKYKLAEPVLQRARAAACAEEGQMLEYLEGLGLQRLPTPFDPHSHYVSKPIEDAAPQLSFDASDMPPEAGVERALTAQLVLIVRLLPAKPILAYSGIGCDLLRRWQSYMQCRTIFKRCHLLWRLYGNDSDDMETGVELLERLSIKVKDTVLPKTDDAVFGNKLKFGGSGQKKDVLQYDGYLLTLCQGELCI